MSVINKATVYRCPNKCGDSRYPQRKWSTLAGYNRHAAECPKRPEAVAAAAAREQARQAQYEAAKSVALANAKYKVGDTIHFVNIYVRRPTHENRNGRMVRMRYEEERIYSARTIVVESVGYNGSVVYNSSIWQDDIRQTFAEAERAADEQRAAYDQQCRFAAECR